MKGMFQATVPNTYASGVASMRTWPPRSACAEPAAALVSEYGVCECGEIKPRRANACARCAKLEAHTDYSGLDEVVFSRFAVGLELTLGELEEFLSGKYPRNAVYRACRRLIEAGRLKRRHYGKRDEMFIYFRA